MVELFEKAKKVLEEKGKIYGEQWKEMKLVHLLSIIKVKVDKMNVTVLYPKLFEQDIIDLVNWLVFLYERNRVRT